MHEAGGVLPAPVLGERCMTSEAATGVSRNVPVVLGYWERAEVVASPTINLVRECMLPSSNHKYGMRRTSKRCWGMEPFIIYDIFPTPTLVASLLYCLNQKNPP